MESVMTALQAILPQHWLSRLVGRLAQLERPVWLKNALINAFMSRYEIDLTDASCRSGEDFPHFNAFFTRSLRDGARPLADAQWCHPADGVLSQRGDVASSELVQAKGLRLNSMHHTEIQKAHCPHPKTMTSSPANSERPLKKRPIQNSRKNCGRSTGNTKV